MQQKDEESLSDLEGDSASTPEAPESRRAAIGRAVALLAFFIGCFLRYQFIFTWNRPDAAENIFNDMLAYLNEARALFLPASGSILNTVYPPGTGWYAGVLLRLDPSFQTFRCMQFLLACLVPVLLSGIARSLYGPGTAWLILGAASLYFPLWEYFGFILSEGPFLVLLLGFFACLIRGLQSPAPRRARIFGGIAGLLLGASAAFKTVSVVTFFFLFIALIALTIRLKVRILPVLLGTGTTFLILLFLLSARATRLNEGRFLLIANDSPRGFLIGHRGRIGYCNFIDRKRGSNYSFISPTAVQRGYTEHLDLEFGPYEGEKVRAAAYEWIREHPLDTFLLSIEHVFDMFALSTSWPGSTRRYYSWSVLSQEIFLMFFLFPAGCFVAGTFRKLVSLDARHAGDVLVLAAGISIYVVAFLVIGEPRYRIPYDPFMMLLAARTFIWWEREPPGFVRSEQKVASKAI